MRNFIDDLREKQNKTFDAIRAGGCGCLRCIQDRGHIAMHMVVCSTCGNKRCPHANDHRNACTNSNEPGQPGSAY
jgi:ribosomal protein L32